MLEMLDEGSDDDMSPFSYGFRDSMLAQAMRNMQMSEERMWTPERSTWERSRTLSGSISSLNSITVPDLQIIREEGNRFFAYGDWVAAVDAYSLCISFSLRKLNSCGPRKSKKTIMNINNVLMLAYSNRAEAWLRLQHYEDALSDADKALAVDPKHSKSLFRKGKAAHGLGLFEKSCKALKAALEEFPDDRSMTEHLKASAMAWKQCLTGEYDLADFYLADIDAEPPSCADFVGPVEIRRVDYGEGRRGLFAARDVKVGELLLVSNPLAIAQETVTNVNTIRRTSEECARIRVLNALTEELDERARKSQRLTAQLYSLCSRGDDCRDIPSMELFKAGSDWVPDEPQEKFDIDEEQMSEIVRLNKTSVTGQSATPDGRILSRTICEGVWAFPSLMNHSCSPNVLSSFVGDAAFFRAAVDIAKGEELTRSYLLGQDSLSLFRNVEFRRTVLQFRCKCARCLFEENLQQKLAKVTRTHSDLMRPLEQGILQGGLNGQHRMHIYLGLLKLIDEVEAVIHGSRLEPKEQGWIRALFRHAYLAKFMKAVDDVEGSLQASAVVALFLDSTIAVCVDSLALSNAVLLLTTVEQWQSKHSPLYRQTLDRVLGVYRLYFGDQPRNVLLKLIAKQPQD